MVSDLRCSHIRARASVQARFMFTFGFAGFVDDVMSYGILEDIG